MIDANGDSPEAREPDAADEATGRRMPAPSRGPRSLSMSDAAQLAHALTAWRAGDLRGREAVCSITFAIVREAAHLHLGRSLRTDGDTGDVVGNVFARFVRQPPPPSVSTAEELIRYLYRSVINDLRDRHRARSRLKREARLAVSMEEPELGHGILHPSPSPSEVAMGRERFERYKAALERLDQRQREAIVLACHVGLESKEAAAEMGFPTAGSYRAFLSRSLAKVSIAMGGD